MVFISARQLGWLALAAGLCAAVPEPLVPLWAMESIANVLLHVWLFCLGATVGSFLNVVVYRLPRGQSLVYPHSYCPRCGHPIRLADNVPLLSWLALGGRCRDCGGRIASRYFWVELTVAALFVLVAWGERVLPVATWSGPLRLPLAAYEVVPYWARYALHVVWATTLVGGVLIQSDTYRTPPALFLPVLVAALGVPLVWPEVRSVAAWDYGPLPAWQAGLIDGLAGLLPGLAIWMAATASRRIAGRGPATYAPLALLAATGAVFGWQRTCLWSGPLLVAYVLSAKALRRLTSAAEEEPVARDGLPAGAEQSPLGEPAVDAHEAPPTAGVEDTSAQLPLLAPEDERKEPL